MDVRTRKEIAYYRRRAEKYGDDYARKFWGSDHTREGLTEIWEEFAGLINPKATSVVDIGCGTGELGDIIKCRRPNIEYHGFDIVPENIKMAQENYPNLHFYVANYWDELVVPSCKFDFVVSFGSLFCTTDESYRPLMFDLLHNVAEKGFLVCSLTGARGLSVAFKKERMERIYDLSFGVTRFHHIGRRTFLNNLKWKTPILIWRDGIERHINVEVPMELTSKDGFLT